jgi:hypothetical protein
MQNACIYFIIENFTSYYQFSFFPIFIPPDIQVKKIILLLKVDDLNNTVYWYIFKLPTRQVTKSNGKSYLNYSLSFLNGDYTLITGILQQKDPNGVISQNLLNGNNDRYLIGQSTVRGKSIPTRWSNNRITFSNARLLSVT